MNQVQYVPVNRLYQVWDEVEPLLARATELSMNECTTDQLKLMLVQEKQTLLVAVDEDGKLTGAMAVELVNFPNDRVAFLTFLGGTGIVDQATFSQVEDWARANGATKVQAWCGVAQARLYQQKAGFEAARMVVEKKL